MRLKGTTVVGPEEVTFGHQELESLGKEVKEDALKAWHCPGRKRSPGCVWQGGAGVTAVGATAEPGVRNPASRQDRVRRGRPSADRAEVALGQGLSGKGSACGPKPSAPDTHRANLC